MANPIVIIGMAIAVMLKAISCAVKVEPKAFDWREQADTIFAGKWEIP